MSEELKSIKHIYGEEMMHLCRELFPDILDCHGVLLEILKDNFYPTHHIGHDIKVNCVKRDFRNFILDIYNKNPKYNKQNRDTKFHNHHAEWERKKYGEIKIKAPFLMLKDAGYDMFECKTEKDVQQFEKYYAPGELICTINGGRTEFAHVFFFVKENVNEIKRSDFPNPQREDKYSTSVLCVQFDKYKPNYVTIISRYNNTVENPNFTYYNDLDNIYPGLTESFKRYYDFTFTRGNSSSSFLSNLKYVKARDGKYHRYSYERYGLFFCDDNTVIKFHNVDKTYTSKERYIFMDEFILDREANEIFAYPAVRSNVSAFLDATTLRHKIVKTKHEVSDTLKMTTIYLTDNKYVRIFTNKENEIIYYENKFVRTIKSEFLAFNSTLLYLNLSNVRVIENDCLNQNNSVVEINAPLVSKIGHGFMPRNVTLEKFFTPNLKNVGSGFLWYNPRFNKKACINYYNNYGRYNSKYIDKDLLIEEINRQRSRGFASFNDKN